MHTQATQQVVENLIFHSDKINDSNLMFFNNTQFCHTTLSSIILPQGLKGALDKYNIIPQLSSNKVGIFIPLDVLAWVMTAC